MHLDDDGHAAAGKRAAGEDGGADERVGRDDGVGLELAQLTPDADSASRSFSGDTTV